MIRSLFLVILPLVIFLVPDAASAQIVQCGRTAEDPCTACHFFGLVSAALTYMIAIITLVITLMVVWSGIKIATAAGNMSTVTEAKRMLTNAIVGFAIVLLAWLLVDTVIKVLAGDTFNAGRPWNRIDVELCAPPEILPFTPSTGNSATTTGSSTPSGAATPSGVSASHDAALAALQGAGITVTSTAGPSGVRGSCTTGTGCTTLNGIQDATVQQTINFANNLREVCPTCQVVVVGGTEPGHAAGTHSHANGYKIDIDDTPQIDAFIRNRLTPAGQRSGDDVYRDSCGNEYVRESTHWDITVTATCSSVTTRG